MTGPLRDLVHAWRALTQKPTIFAGALFTVALGICANVAIFSLVNAISLRPMPFGDRTDRLTTILVAHRLNVDEPGWGDLHGPELSYRAPDLSFELGWISEGRPRLSRNVQHSGGAECRYCLA